MDAYGRFRICFYHKFIDSTFNCQRLWGSEINPVPFVFEAQYIGRHCKDGAILLSQLNNLPNLQNNRAIPISLIPALPQIEPEFLNFKGIFKNEAFGQGIFPRDLKESICGQIFSESEGFNIGISR